MDQPKIPTLKDSQKPQVKVRGLGAGMNLFDRIKQFKKKDLAFILAGLGTLFMAPLAEHFMMSPDTGGDMSAGVGGGGHGGSGLFTNGSPYDRGTGEANGSPIGGDLITPLNARDPSSLILGPGSASQPPTNSAAPTAPPVVAPPSASESGLKDALAAGAATAANQAIRHAFPKIGLGNSNLRGLGVATGGSSATAGGGGVSSQGLGLKGGGGSGDRMLAKPTAGYGGVARGQGTGGSGDALSALKKAADAQGNLLNRNGSAGANLAAAANASMPSGSGGALGGNGAGGSAAGDKPDAGSSAKDSKSTGESLAYQLMKENLEKQLELYWKEKEAMDPTLELYKLRNSMAEGIAGSFSSAMGTWLGNTVTGWLGGPTSAGYYCTPDGGGPPVNIPGLAICQPGQNCGSTTGTSAGQGGGATTGGTACSWMIQSGRLMPCASSLPAGTPSYAMANCTPVGSPSSKPSGTTPPAPATPGICPNGGSDCPGAGVGSVAKAVADPAVAGGITGIQAQCQQITTLLGASSALDVEYKNWLVKALASMKKLDQSHAILDNGQTACGNTPAVPSGSSIVPQAFRTVISNVGKAADALKTGKDVDNSLAADSGAMRTNAQLLVDARGKLDGNADSAKNSIKAAQDLAAGTLPACSAATCVSQQVTQINGAYTNGQAAMNKLASSETDTYGKVNTLLKQAEEAGVKQTAATPPNEAAGKIDGLAATDPTLKQVEGMNTMESNLEKAIQKANGGTATPATPVAGALTPPTIQPVAGSASPAAAAGDSPTAGVNTKVATAETAIKTACTAIGYDCTKSTPTKLDPPPTNQPPAQPLITAVTQPITDARTAQQTGLGTISANAAAMNSPTAAGPAVASAPAQ